MWIIQLEKKYIDTRISRDTEEPSGFWMMYPIAQRSDGATVRVKGPWQGGADRFQYQDSEVSFEFVASRFGANIKLTNTYEIYSSPPKNLESAKAIEIIRNIKEALLLMPPLAATA